MEVSGTADEMFSEGVRLFEKFGDVSTIKVPTREGLDACYRLSKELVKTNVTLVFCETQQSSWARLGATYVSPFVGRLDDQSVAGLEVVRSITGLYQIHGIRTQVLSASIRSIQRVVRSYYNGNSGCNNTPDIFDKMYDHILTDVGMEIFEKDLKLVETFT